MSDAAVAKRYAEALFQLGNEKGTMDQLAEEFHVLKTTFDENNELVPFLKHPRVNNEQKEQFINNVFQSFSADVVNLLHLLAERHRIDIVPSVIDHFIRLVNDAKGMEEATVYSIRELSQTEKERLEKTFAKRFGKQAIKITSVVDPSVIGGIKLRIGNTIYDGSIQGKLKRIERGILTAN
ncbi:F0F1 ATP synthase subunit delta [Lentibacillus juripiscarius]|uniref:ATP synthase subunit delta n=1 Tax=Lentibacillus juripiscarius TaxID=257446 RepID=A0ABW5V838_9BACI